jgi:hypothetical protein
VRIIGCVPGVFQVGEGFWGVFCAKDEVALCVVRFEICIEDQSEALLLELWLLDVPSANALPTTWWISGSPAGYSPYFALQPTISATNFFFVGSLGGNARSRVISLPLLLASGLVSLLLKTSSRKMQRRLCAAEEDVGCGDPVLGFGVARCDYAELLVGFIVLAFCDPEHVSEE